MSVAGEIPVEEYHSHRGECKQQAGTRQEKQVPEDERAGYQIKPNPDIVGATSFPWSLLGTRSPWERGHMVSLGTRLKERAWERGCSWS